MRAKIERDGQIRGSSVAARMGEVRPTGTGDEVTTKSVAGQ